MDGWLCRGQPPDGPAGRRDWPPAAGAAAGHDPRLPALSRPEDGAARAAGRRDHPLRAYSLADTAVLEGAAALDAGCDPRGPARVRHHRLSVQPRRPQLPDDV